MKILVLGVKSYDFKNDNGESVKGTKVYYVTNERIEGVEGIPPMCVTVQDNDFSVLPAIYDADFGMKQGKNNKPEIVLKKSTLLSPVDIITSDTGEVFISTNINSNSKK